MSEQNLYAPTSAQLPDDAPPKRNRHIRTIISGTALLFSVPIMLWMLYQMSRYDINAMPSYRYTVGMITGISGFIGPYIGVWLTGYSVIRFQPRKFIHYPLYGLVHASIWLALFSIFMNLVALWKFKEAFPIIPFLHTTIILFIQFYFYSLIILVCLRFAIQFYDKHNKRPAA